MKLLPKLALIGVGGFVLVKLISANIINRLNFIVTGIQLGFVGTTPTVTLSIAIQNPTGSSFTINSIVGNVFLNGSFIGNVSSFVTTAIPPNGQVTLPVTVLLNISQVISDIIHVIDGSAGIQALIELQATANIDNLAFPLDVSYKLL